MKQTERIALSAMFVAVMLVLGYIESMIPIGGMPGIKLGLSNSVLLLSLYWLGIPVSIQLMLIKVVLSGITFSGVNAMMYALAGGVLSLAAMILMIHGIRDVSPIGAGIAGGVMHNVGQITLAMLVLQTTSLLAYMAILMVVGAVMGAVTGTVAKLLMVHLPPKFAPPKRKSRSMPTPEGDRQSAP